MTFAFSPGRTSYGQKIEKSAIAAGLDPRAFTDRVSENFRALSKIMGFSNDDFIRTTEERHLRSCQALWLRLKERGEIYLGSYSGWYAVRDEAFYGESELTTRADGRKIAPSGAEAEWVRGAEYFFRLSAWQERLLAFYRNTPISSCRNPAATR
jgi:methionyl-tRNA synthetase